MSICIYFIHLFMVELTYNNNNININYHNGSDGVRTCLSFILYLYLYKYKIISGRARVYSITYNTTYMHAWYV
jgi:hypothetical protein